MRLGAYERYFQSIASVVASDILEHIEEAERAIRDSISSMLPSSTTLQWKSVSVIRMERVLGSKAGNSDHRYYLVSRWLNLF